MKIERWKYSDGSYHSELFKKTISGNEEYELIEIKNYLVYIGPDTVKDYIISADEENGSIIYALHENEPNRTRRKFGKVYIVRTT